MNIKLCGDTSVHLCTSLYISVHPGWHQSKKHWNTVFTENTPSNFKEMITHAYEVVVSGLTKKLREELEGERG